MEVVSEPGGRGLVSSAGFLAVGWGKGVGASVVR